MTTAYLNRIATAVPPHDIHHRFNQFAPLLLAQDRERVLFERMISKAHIKHRYSFLRPDSDGQKIDGEGFYKLNDFPDTAKRMAFYKDHAFKLASQALDQFDPAMLKTDITHLIVTSCTGFYAPGLDVQIIKHFGLKVETERTMIGFMGCQAAFNGMKLARHIVLSTPKSKVLMINLELCTLHLQQTDKIEQLLSYLIFADGCAATIISAEAQGLALDSFYCTLMSESSDQITWHIGNSGFDMVLSGQVPTTISSSLPAHLNTILNNHKASDIPYWAIHPGGRTILDAVQKGFSLEDQIMEFSRKILSDYGNMSSATVMFVLKDILEAKTPEGPGCAMAFGPGVTLESMLFRKVS